MPTFSESADAFLQRGNAFYQQGRLDDAVASYRDALRIDPDFAPAHNNVANVLHGLGRLNEAVAHYEAALKLQPDMAHLHNNLGATLKDLGRLDEAVTRLHHALRINPQYAEAHNNLGNALMRQGHNQEAVECFRRALQISGNYAEAINNLGIALKNQGRLEEAEVQCRRAAQIVPHVAEVHCNLGTVLELKGAASEATMCYHHALTLRPTYADAWYNLAHVHQTQHNLEEASRCYLEVLRLRPDHLEALVNFAEVLRQRDKHEDAAWCLREALRYRPDYADAYYHLATVFCELNRIDEAVASYQEALKLKPEYPNASAELGVLLENQGKPEQAIACYEEALKLRPLDHLRVMMAACQPVIHQSVAEMDFWRDRARRETLALRTSDFICDVTEVPLRPLFYGAYHGRNDRDILRETALLYRAPQPFVDVSARVASGGKARIHVGFISTYFSNHTIGHWMRGLITKLDRDEFQVTVLSIGNRQDEVTEFIKKYAECVLSVPKDLPAARQLISQLGLDILCYSDIGIDAFTSTLALSRLAPVQCVMIGHPVTTGIDTIDYFISTEDLEVEEADEHYTETLIRLKKLPFYYYPPAVPKLLHGREDFGLSRHSHVYACTQSMFKLHPDFDEALGDTLRADSEGVLVLISGQLPQWDEQLKRRFARTLPDVLSRIRFLPRLNLPDYMNLLMCTDVLLDSRPFGGGTTSFEGLSVGTPIVTMPSRLLRGRITFALYKQMNVLDCVAHAPQEYVGIATRLGKDADYRQAIKQKILESNSLLFQNSGGIRYLEQFFRDVV